MHQHGFAADIIRMEILNLKIVNEYRIFKQFVLDLLNDYVFAVKQLQSVTRTQLYGFCPPFDRNPERMAAWCD